MSRKSSRQSSRKVAQRISLIAQGDLLPSDEEEFPVQLVDSDGNVISPEGDDEDDEVTLVQQFGGDDEDVDEEEDEEEDEAQHDEGRNDMEEDSSDPDELQRRKRKRSATSDDDDADDEHEEDLDGEEEEDGDDDVDEEPKKKAKKRAKSVHPITYTISVLAPAPSNAKKSKLRKADTVKLNSDEPFDTLKAQILVKIAAVRNPARLEYTDYDTTFKIPRTVPEPIPLDSDDKYTHLLENASDKGVVIASAAADSDGDSTKNKAKKTKIPSAREILPANVALNEKIGLIRTRWTCPAPNGPCGSTYCFVNPNSPEHFPLGHEHTQVWGSALLKGEAFATLDKPPNHYLFDALGNGALGRQTALMERRTALRAEKNTGGAPTVNIHFPPELMQLAHRQAAPVAHAAPIPVPMTAVPMLIPPPLLPGPSMSIMQFCELYNLDDEICGRLSDNKFKNTDTFAYIELADLKGMEFKFGEIAELKVAIAAWAQRP